MRLRDHSTLLLQSVGAWCVFWLAGLPSYYQQYSFITLAAGCVLFSVAMSLVAILVLRGGQDKTRMSRAFWVAAYFTIPFAVLDTAYCGWYLGNGSEYIAKYWYLTVFYLTPWLTFLPTAALLRHRVATPPRA